MKGRHILSMTHMIQYTMPVDNIVGIERADTQVDSHFAGAVAAGFGTA